MEKLTYTKKLLLRMFVDYKCEECHNNEDEVGKLQAHRIKRGGEYELRNIKMVCSKCHKKYHSREFK